MEHQVTVDGGPEEGWRLRSSTLIAICVSLVAVVWVKFLLRFIGMHNFTSEREPAAAATSPSSESTPKVEEAKPADEPTPVTNGEATPAEEKPEESKAEVAAEPVKEEIKEEVPVEPVAAVPVEAAPAEAAPAESNTALPVEESKDGETNVEGIKVEETAEAESAAKEVRNEEVAPPLPTSNPPSPVTVFAESTKAESFPIPLSESLPDPVAPPSLDNVSVKEDSFVTNGEVEPVKGHDSQGNIEPMGVVTPEKNEISSPVEVGDVSESLREDENVIVASEEVSPETEAVVGALEKEPDVPTPEKEVTVDTPDKEVVVDTPELKCYEESEGVKESMIETSNLKEVVNEVEELVDKMKELKVETNASPIEQETSKGNDATEVNVNLEESMVKMKDNSTASMEVVESKDCVIATDSVSSVESQETPSEVSNNDGSGGTELIENTVLTTIEPLSETEQNQESPDASQTIQKTDNSQVVDELSFYEPASLPDLPAPPMESLESLPPADFPPAPLECSLPVPEPMSDPIVNADSLPDISTESLPSLPEPVSESLPEPMSLPPVDSIPEPIAPPECKSPPAEMPLTNGTTNGLSSPLEKHPTSVDGPIKQIPVEAITGNGTEEKKDDGDKVEAVELQAATVEE